MNTPVHTNDALLSRNDNAPADSASSRRRILVIDHHVDISRLLCDRLEAIGFDAVAEDSGLSGLLRLGHEQASTPFHGVLVELQMPTLGGLAVLQEMCERFPHVPVIVMSDSANVGKLRLAMNAGAKEYLVKPFDFELLRRKCLNVFQGRHHDMTRTNE